MDTLHDAPHPARRRTRRWLIAGAAITLLLAAYAAGLRWAAERLATDLTAALRPAETQDTRHRTP